MVWRKSEAAQSRVNRKPRVLVVGPVFPKGGGVGTVDMTLLTSCLAERFEMTHLDTGRTRAGEGKAAKLAPINLYYFARQAVQLFWILLFERPDIMHQSVSDQLAFWKESSFILIARVFGVKTVAHVHGYKLGVELGEGSPLRRRLMAVALHLPHVIVVLSEYWRPLLYEQVSPRLNVAVVPNSVDRSIAAAMAGITSKPEREGCRVLFLAWLSTSKGLLDALRAVPLVHQQVPDAQFVFAGAIQAGPQKGMIEQACEAAKLEGNVSFPGLVTGDKKLALLSEASIFILPSYRDNLPVAILEAMAMGLPVVTTPIGGVPDLIEDGRNGFLIKPGDYVALADRIVRLTQDAELRRSMGQTNSARVRTQYHPDVFAAKIASLYENLLTCG